MQHLFTPLMNQSMGNMDTFNPHFKIKRQILSSAVFKDKLKAITNIVKDVALKYLRGIQDDKIE